MDFEPTRLPEVVLIRPRAFEDERAVRWDDPTIGIRWPLPPGIAPQLPPKDQAAPLLGDAETYA